MTLEEEIGFVHSNIILRLLVSLNKLKFFLKKKLITILKY